MGTAAFFDLDNTIVRGSSMYFLARQLVREGIVTRRMLVRFAWMEARFVATRREHSGDRARVTASALALVKGRGIDEVDGLCRRAASRMLHKRLMGPTLRRLRDHQMRGDETWLVTASPVEMARVVAELLGMTGAIATTPAIDDGRYTGELSGAPMHGARKAETIVRIARERGLNLAFASAYSDSQNDVPMLTLVGDAAVVNANRRFQRIARERGWRVLDDPCTRIAVALHGLRTLGRRSPDAARTHRAVAEVHELVALTSMSRAA